MALSSAMYAAVTGLSALGTGMQTISNNISNVNTVGFKAGRTNYEDLLSQNYYSSGRVNQRGTGVKVSSIQSMFTQGAFMSSAQDTDMAIAGEGFFAVRNHVTDSVQYTRAGVFTLNKDGYMEDPSGNILQGWQMSIPKPGQEAVRIGAPTDVKITVLNAPPVESSQMKVVVNLNADDDSAYHYDEYELAEEMAAEIAAPYAESARAAAIVGYWNPPADTTTSLAGPVPTGINPSNHSDFNMYFLQQANHNYGTSAATLAALVVVSDGSTPNRAAHQITVSEYNSLVTITTKEVEAEAQLRGLTAYTTTFSNVKESTKNAIVARLPSWNLEGNGFAGAWNAQENPPIDPENYTHVEPMTIYDTLGNEHKLMIYYQKNPHMAQVWDYIITCDPLEDARKDGNLALLFSETASFSGLVQKGKITFTADGDDRHGGMIKDIEAQNIDLSRTLMAKSDLPVYTSASTATMRNATIGGYFNGSPYIDTSLGSEYQYKSSARTYSLVWGGPDPNNPAGPWIPNVGTNPPSSGLTWTDSAGNTGFIRIDDPRHPGPYQFGSGLTITFGQDQLPLHFGTPGSDNLAVTAHSEQVAWTNLAPNKQGYFDFDVAFVQSASMALHPPYPDGLPTVIQNIAFDMGAKRNPNGTDPKWLLDEQSTTQFAAKSSTVFKAQDGYSAGSLQRVSIGADGVITGIYTNGRQQPLYQIGLTRFLNPWGLSKEGDNLFSATRYSGEGALNPPGYGGTGTILGNFLEQSNVDLAEEIVNMIITQRGFQANSKTVTTTDTMLA